MKINPLADRVLIRPLDKPEVKKGGIIIPDTAQEKPQEGEVVAVGKGRLDSKGVRIAPEVKTGDKVLFRKYSGTEVSVDEVKYLILQEADILATL
jgi:chaperonin GroES